MNNYTNIEYNSQRWTYNIPDELVSDLISKEITNNNRDYMSSFIAVNLFKILLPTASGAFRHARATVWNFGSSRFDACC